MTRSLTTPNRLMAPSGPVPARGKGPDASNLPASRRRAAVSLTGQDLDPIWSDLARVIAAARLRRSESGQGY